MHVLSSYIRIMVGWLRSICHIINQKCYDMSATRVVVKSLDTLVKNMHIMAVLNSNDFYNSHFFCDGMSAMHSTTQKYTHNKLSILVIIESCVNQIVFVAWPLNFF